jgi:hypothetical protein
MALLWSLIFVLGGISGWVGHCIYRNDKSAAQAKDQEFQKIMNTMARELKLDPQQKMLLKNIFDESRMKYRALNKQFRPQYVAIRDDSDDQIRKMLRPEQKTRFEELLRPYRPQKSTPK